MLLLPEATTVTAYTVAAAAPLVSKTILPPPVAQVAPVVYSHAAPVAPYGHVAAAVAHVAFDGFGTHWGY